MNIKLTENEHLLHMIARKHAKDVNSYYREFYDLFKNQPERLSPEGVLKACFGNSHIVSTVLKSTCDSPNSENK